MKKRPYIEIDDATITRLYTAARHPPPGGAHGPMEAILREFVQNFVLPVEPTDLHLDSTLTGIELREPTPVRMFDVTAGKFITRFAEGLLVRIWLGSRPDVGCTAVTSLGDYIHVTLSPDIRPEKK